MVDLVPNYRSNCTVIHVLRTVAGVEYVLQDTNGNLYKFKIVYITVL
jgi:hypothetical protein